MIERSGASIAAEERRKKLGPVAVQLRKRGLSLKAVAEALGGCSISFVHRLLVEQGFEEPPALGTKKSPRQKPKTGRFAHLR